MGEMPFLLPTNSVKALKEEVDFMRRNYLIILHFWGELEGKSTVRKKVKFMCIVR